MNAHLSEHVNRSNHRANDNPNQPKRRPPPSSVLDKEVERYFDGPLHQEKLSKWEQLSEIPTARELLRPQYVLIDDSHLQEPSDDQPAWEDFNTWGGADGCTAADAIDGQTEDPFAMANAWDQNASTWDNPHAQSTEQSDFAQTTDNAFDVPEPVSEWDAPQAVVNEFGVPNYGATASAFEELSAPDDGAAASGSDEFGASDNDATASGFDEFGAPDTGAPASGSDQFGAPDNGATASGSDSAASEPNGDTNGTDDGRSSTTEVPNHVQEDSQLGDTTIPSSPPSEADGEEPSHGSPEDSTTEQSTNIISDNDADSNANGEDSTNATTVDEVAVKPDDDNEIADLDSQEPSRLQAFNSLGPWPSKKKYLHTHYMLLREDALRHLKEAIQTLRSNPTMTERDGDKSIGIYDDVSLLARTGVSCSSVSGPCQGPHACLPRTRSEDLL